MSQQEQIIREKAMEFWYQFDEFFQFSATAQIKEALIAVLWNYKLGERFMSHYRIGTLYTDFKTEVEQLKSSFEILAINHFDIVNRLLQNNQLFEKRAFEYFGEGTLFDNRRVNGAKVHMMDRSTGGYYDWHAFIRAIVIANVSGDTTIPPNWWLKIDQYVALAAAIDAIKHPVQSNDPNKNKPIDQDTLNTLEAKWLNQSFEQLDNEFINNTFGNM